MTWEDPALMFPDIGLDPGQVNPAQLAPPTGLITDLKGQSLLVASTTQVFLLQNFISLKVPQAREKTPSDLGSYAIQAIAISPFFTKTAIPAYILASDGTNSAVWYTPNVAAVVPSWTKGTSATGIYRVLRTTNTASAILIYSPTSAATGSLTITFSAGGYTLDDGTVVGSGGNPGACLESNDKPAGSMANMHAQITVYLPISGSTVTRVQWDAKKLQDTPLQLESHARLYDASNNLLHDYIDTNSGAANTWYSVDTGAVSIAGVDHVQFEIIAGGSLNELQGWMDNCHLEYTGSNDGGVRYSSDDGATFGTVLSVGTPPSTSIGGFDVQRAGGNSFAASDSAIYRATTINGSYSSYYSITGSVQAHCIIVPYVNWSGARQTAATNPDILVGLSAADGSSRTLLWIEGGATPSTVHDLTPVAGSSFDNPNAITCRYASEIALFCNVSGAYKLYKTTNANSGATWSLVKTLSAPKWIRCRRNDDRAVPNGQCYLLDSNAWYTSVWYSSGPYVRTMPVTPMIAADTVW